MITNIGNKQKLIYFNYPASDFETWSYIDVIGSINKKFYQGNTYLEFNVKEAFPSK